MKIKHLLNAGFLLLSFLMSFHGKAQSTHTPELDFTIGQLVSTSPDSIFKATANAFTGDSISVTSVRLVISDSSFIAFDQQFVIASLPTVQSAIAWREEYMIHIDIPDYNPFKRKHYLMELIGTNGQLLLQIEKEF